MTRLLLALALLALAVWAVRRWLGPGFGRGPSGGFKCRTCRHCRRLDADGVMCGFGDKQVFKNPAQIAMCPDHTPRRSGRA
jgi:hypothetical protein